MSSITYTFYSKSVQETQRAAQLLARCAKPGMVVALDGTLGAGKTHFVQGLATGLGIEGTVTSPTFTVMVAYPEGRLPLYHFDLYRLENILELEDIAFYDYVESSGLSCIEWAEKFPSEIPAEALRIIITIQASEVRCITASAHEPSTAKVLNAWAALLEEDNTL